MEKKGHLGFQSNREEMTLSKKRSPISAESMVHSGADEKHWPWTKSGKGKTTRRNRRIRREKKKPQL